MIKDLNIYNIFMRSNKTIVVQHKKEQSSFGAEGLKESFLQKNPVQFLLDSY